MMKVWTIFQPNLGDSRDEDDPCASCSDCGVGVGYQ